MTHHTQGRWLRTWTSILRGIRFQTCTSKRILRGDRKPPLAQAMGKEIKTDGNLIGTISWLTISNSLASLGIAMHERKQIYFFKGITLGHEQSKYVTTWMAVQLGQQGEKNISMWGGTSSHRDRSSLHFTWTLLTIDEPISQTILKRQGGKRHVRMCCSQKCCFKTQQGRF